MSKPLSMNPLADILRRIKERNPDFKQRLEEASSMDRWEEAVGASIARHARALRVEAGGVLVVEVDNPIWMAELAARKTQILKALAGDGPALITDIRWEQPRGQAPKHIWTQKKPGSA